MVSTKFDPSAKFTLKESFSIVPWASPTPKSDISIVKDVPDLEIISSLYRKVDERNRMTINNNLINAQELKRINVECLNLTKSALNKIDWNKYIPKKLSLKSGDIDWKEKWDWRRKFSHPPCKSSSLKSSPASILSHFF